LNKLLDSLQKAIMYADRLDIWLPVGLRTRARRVGAIKAGGDLPGITSIYNDSIIQAIIAYFDGGSLVSSRNMFKRAMVDAFSEAFDLGWIDGGQKFPLDDDAADWLAVRTEEEFGHIDGLFESAKDLKKDKEFDYFKWAEARAAGYIGTVQGIYNAGRLFAEKNKMLTWHLGETEQHCPECQELDGTKHRASWYLKKNYIPRKPGASMTCGGYNCDCYLTDDKGNEVTI